MDATSELVTVSASSSTIATTKHTSTNAFNVNQSNNNIHTHANTHIVSNSLTNKTTTTSNQVISSNNINIGGSSNSSSSNSNSSCSSSSTSSNSSGYGSTTTTPTNNYDLQQTTPTTTPIPTTPVGIPEHIIPVATVAAVTPFYNESLTTHNLETHHVQHHRHHPQQQQQLQQQPHHLLQTNHHQFSQNHLQTNVQQHHQQQQQHQYLPRQQYYSPYDYQQAAPMHNLSGTSGTPAIAPYNMIIPGSYEMSPSAVTPSYGAGQYKSSSSTDVTNYERSPVVKTNMAAAIYNQQQQQQQQGEQQQTKTLTHQPRHHTEMLASSKQRSSSLISNSTNTNTSKPQAAATPFYANPTPYYDNFKHKISLDLHDTYSNPSATTAATYQQQQKYYAAAKSQLKEASYGPPTGLNSKSLYPNTSNFYPGSTGGLNLSTATYDNFMYSHNPATGYSTTGHLGNETPTEVSNYRKSVGDTAINSPSWPWGIDYASGNSRSIPPPPANHLPTATVAPTHATHLSQNPAALSRDPYYMSHDKYGVKYDKYMAPSYQQTYVSPPANRHIWPNTPHVTSNLTQLNDRHLLATGPPALPAHGIHTTPYFPNNSTTGLNSRQSCCSQPYQPQSCYYPPSHPVPPRLHHNQTPAVTPPTGGYLTPQQSLGQSPHLNALSASCKYGGVLPDYGNGNKIKNSNDLYLNMHHYDNNPTPHSYGYGSGHNSQQFYAANPHQSIAHGSTPGSLLTNANPTSYTNDLSLTTSNFDNYHTHLDTHPSQQTLAEIHNQQPPPAYGPTVAKRALLDYRKPIQLQPPPTAAEDFYTTFAPRDHYNQQELLNTPETTTTFGEYETHQSNSTSLSTAVLVETDSEREESNKNLSLRDFIANWNDDEDEYQNNEEMNFDQNNVIEEVLQTVPPMEQEAAASLVVEDTVVIKPSLLDSKKDESLKEPVDSVEILNDSDVNQYANLPDIVIDIEKSNNVNHSVVTTTSSPTPSPQDEVNNTSLNLTNFDVEKELDELNLKKPAPQELTKDLNDIQELTNVTTPQISPCKNLTSQLSFEDLNLEPANKTVLNTATTNHHSSELSEQYFKDIEGYESSSSRHSNESAFEKEYETFINKISSESSTSNGDDKKTVEAEKEIDFVQNVHDFSKFYKRKRKLREDELKSAVPANQNKKKLKTTLATKVNNSNFPQVYTKKARNRLNKIKLQNSHRRKPLSAFYKIIHSIRRFGLNRDKRVREYMAELKEKHLPLIKRQSIKNYTHEICESLFNAPTLKALCVMAINTHEFRQSLMLRMEEEQDNCLESEEKHICVDPTCETCEVIKSLMEAESFETTLVQQASGSNNENSTLPSAMFCLEANNETITVLEDTPNTIDLNIRNDELILISGEIENVQNAKENFPVFESNDHLEKDIFNSSDKNSFLSENVKSEMDIQQQFSQAETNVGIQNWCERSKSPNLDLQSKDCSEISLQPTTNTNSEKSFVDTDTLKSEELVDISRGNTLLWGELQFLEKIDSELAIPNNLPDSKELDNSKNLENMSLESNENSTSETTKNTDPLKFLASKQDKESESENSDSSESDSDSSSSDTEDTSVGDNKDSYSKENIETDTDNDSDAEDNFVNSDSNPSHQSKNIKPEKNSKNHIQQTPSPKRNVDYSKKETKDFIQTDIQTDINTDSESEDEDENISKNHQRIVIRITKSLSSNDHSLRVENISEKSLKSQAEFDDQNESETKDDEIEKANFEITSNTLNLSLDQEDNLEEYIPEKSLETQTDNKMKEQGVKKKKLEKLSAPLKLILKRKVSMEAQATKISADSETQHANNSESESEDNDILEKKTEVDEAQATKISDDSSTDQANSSKSESEDNDILEKKTEVDEAQATKISADSDTDQANNSESESEDNDILEKKTEIDEAQATKISADSYTDQANNTESESEDNENLEKKTEVDETTRNEYKDEESLEKKLKLSPTKEDEDEEEEDKYDANIENNSAVMASTLKSSAIEANKEGSSKIQILKTTVEQYPQFNKYEDFFNDNSSEKSCAPHPEDDIEESISKETPFEKPERKVIEEFQAIAKEENGTLTSIGLKTMQEDSKESIAFPQTSESVDHTEFENISANQVEVLKLREDSVSELRQDSISELRQDSGEDSLSELGQDTISEFGEDSVSEHSSSKTAVIFNNTKISAKGKTSKLGYSKNHYTDSESECDTKEEIEIKNSDSFPTSFKIDKNQNNFIKETLPKKQRNIEIYEILDSDSEYEDVESDNDIYFRGENQDSESSYDCEYETDDNDEILKPFKNLNNQNPIVISDDESMNVCETNEELEKTIKCLSEAPQDSLQQFKGITEFNDSKTSEELLVKEDSEIFIGMQKDSDYSNDLLDLDSKRTEQAKHEKEPVDISHWSCEEEELSDSEINNTEQLSAYTEIHEDSSVNSSAKYLSEHSSSSDDSDEEIDDKTIEESLTNSKENLKCNECDKNKDDDKDEKCNECDKNKEDDEDVFLEGSGNSELRKEILVKQSCVTTSDNESTTESDVEGTNFQLYPTWQKHVLQNSETTKEDANTINDKNETVEVLPATTYQSETLTSEFNSEKLMENFYSLVKVSKVKTLKELAEKSCNLRNEIQQNGLSDTEIDTTKANSSITKEIKSLEENLVQITTEVKVTEVEESITLEGSDIPTSETSSLIFEQKQNIPQVIKQVTIEKLRTSENKVIESEELLTDNSEIILEATLEHTNLVRPKEIKEPATPSKTSDSLEDVNFEDNSIDSFATEEWEAISKAKFEAIDSEDTKYIKTRIVNLITNPETFSENSNISATGYDQPQNESNTELDPEKSEKNFEAVTEKSGCIDKVNNTEMFEEISNLSETTADKRTTEIETITKATNEEPCTNNLNEDIENISKTKAENRESITPAITKNNDILENLENTFDVETEPSSSRHTNILNENIENTQPAKSENFDNLENHSENIFDIKEQPRNSRTTTILNENIDNIPEESETIPQAKKENLDILEDYKIENSEKIFDMEVQSSSSGTTNFLNENVENIPKSEAEELETIPPVMTENYVHLEDYKTEHSENILDMEEEPSSSRPPTVLNKYRENHLEKSETIPQAMSEIFDISEDHKIENSENTFDIKDSKSNRTINILKENLENIPKTKAEESEIIPRALTENFDISEDHKVDHFQNTFDMKEESSSSRTTTIFNEDMENISEESETNPEAVNKNFIILEDHKTENSENKFYRKEEPRSSRTTTILNENMENISEESVTIPEAVTENFVFLEDQKAENSENKFDRKEDPGSSRTTTILSENMKNISEESVTIPEAVTENFVILEDHKAETSGSSFYINAEPSSSKSTNILNENVVNIPKTKAEESETIPQAMTENVYIPESHKTETSENISDMKEEPNSRKAITILNENMESISEDSEPIPRAMTENFDILEDQDIENSENKFEMERESGSDKPKIILNENVENFLKTKADVLENIPQAITENFDIFEDQKIENLENTLDHTTTVNEHNNKETLSNPRSDEIPQTISKDLEDELKPITEKVEPAKEFNTEIFKTLEENPKPTEEFVLISEAKNVFTEDYKAENKEKSESEYKEILANSTLDIVEKEEEYDSISQETRNQSLDEVVKVTRQTDLFAKSINEDFENSSEKSNDVKQKIMETLANKIDECGSEIHNLLKSEDTTNLEEVKAFEEEAVIEHNSLPEAEYEKSDDNMAVAESHEEIKEVDEQTLTKDDKLVSAKTQVVEKSKTKHQTETCKSSFNEILSQTVQDKDPTTPDDLSDDFFGFKNQSSFEDESEDFHGFEDLEEVTRIRQEIENLKDDSAANDGFLTNLSVIRQMHNGSTSSLNGSTSSEINELEALEKELSQHQLDLKVEEDHKETENDMPTRTIEVISSNDIEHIKQMLESDEEQQTDGEDQNQNENENLAHKPKDKSVENSKNNNSNDIIISSVNSNIPKLSDLCRAALNSSLNSIRNFAQQHTETSTILAERELSVEEALAEMYRQAGVLLSDPEDCDNDIPSPGNNEAHDVLLINLQEILNSDNNEVYVLQCDINENVLNVVQSTEELDEERQDNADVNAERVNTLQIILDTQNPETQIHIISSDSESDVIILSDDESDFNYRPFRAREESVTIPFINDEVISNSNDVFDISTISHEEIVPDNLHKFLQEEFYKYLHEKYVQRNISKYYHANRVLKKYKKRFVRSKMQ